MQTNHRSQRKTLAKTVAATALAGTALATAAWAQFGGGGPTPPSPAPPSAPPSGAMPFPGPRPGGNIHFPIAGGTVSAVDAGAGTITVTPRFGNGLAQTIKVADSAPITSQMAATVSDLKVGDTVQVRGVPTGITASQITASDGADSSPASPFGMEQPGGFGGRTGTASAQASGKITGLHPLTVSVGGGVSVTLQAAPDVRVARIVSAKLGDVKVGDQVMATGQTGDDGVFTAQQVRVNMDGGFGMGMGGGGGRPAMENPRRVGPPPAPTGPQGGGSSGEPVMPGSGSPNAPAPPDGTVSE